MRVTDSHLGQVIKTAREKEGLTQAALAERVGCSVRHIAAIENEGETPSFDLLYKLIRGLNIPSDLIFYPEIQSEELWMRELNNMIYKCDVYSKGVIRATVKAMLENQPKE